MKNKKYHTVGTNDAVMAFHMGVQCQPSHITALL